MKNLPIFYLTLVFIILYIPIGYLIFTLLIKAEI